MAKQDNLPFPIGTSYFDGQTAETTSGEAITLEGKEYNIEDLDYSKTGAKPYRTARLRKVMVMRNVSGIALLPKRLAIPQKAGADGKFYVGRVDGMCSVGPAGNPSGPCYPIDEFLPAAGVPNNDLFYAVVEGPAMILTGLAADATNVFNVGDWVVAATAATSQATTAGRPAPQDLTGATAILGNNIQNRIGRALSAVTTSNTNANLLIVCTKI